MEAERRKGTRRLYDAGRAPGPTAFPRGLSGFGQRWEDREFDLDAAERELFELLSDLPGLADSALAMVDLWHASGRLSQEERDRISHRIRPDSRSDGETITRRPPPPDEPESEMAGTDPLAKAPSGGAEAAAKVRSRVPDLVKPKLEPGDVIADRYELLRRVASGSMGVVYQARDKQAPADSAADTVAIKVLSPALVTHGPAIRALQREAQAGLFLDHPRIARTFGLERDGALFFIVMEWLDGASLADWMGDHHGRPVPLDDVSGVLTDIASALSYAHEKGLVHADIKPGNIMLLDDGTARLCDFGIARFDETLTAGSGSFDPAVLRAATPAYSSPEILRGEKPTIQDDIYSLACVAYRLLSGRRVFGIHDSREAEEKGLKPSPIDGIDERQWDALNRALSMERSQRQTSVENFMTEFLGQSALFELPEALETPAAPPLEQEEPARVDTEEPSRQDSGKASTPGQESVRERRGGARLGIALILLVALGVGSYFFVPMEDFRQIVTERLRSMGFDGKAPVAVGGTGQRRDAEVSPSARRSPDSEDSAAAGGRPAGSETPSGDLGPAQSRIASGSAADADLAAASISLRLSPVERQPDLVEINIGEDEGSVVIELERIERLDELLQLEIMPVTREDGFTDSGTLAFSLVEPTIRMEPGVKRYRLEIALPDDDAITGSRKYGFYVAQVVPELRLIGRIELNVRDDELADRADYLPAGTLSFAAFTDSVSENASAARIRLVRYGGYETARSTTVLISGVGATEGDDYTGPSEHTIRFPPGADNVTLYIPIVNDSIPEPEEGLRVVLDDPTGPVSSPSELYIRIIDDDV